MLEQRGTTLQQALATLRQCLPPDAVLVGQGIGQDVQWLQLHEGRDFQVAAAAGLGSRDWDALMCPASSLAAEALLVSVGDGSLAAL